MISRQILIFIMFCYPENMEITEYKKEKWAKVYVKYYVFICYVNSSRMRNTRYMVGLEKPHIIKRLEHLGSQRVEKHVGHKLCKLELSSSEYM